MTDLIRICKLSPMHSTPFSDEDLQGQAYLHEQGVRFVDFAEPCDLFLTVEIPAYFFSKKFQLSLFWRYPFRARVLLFTTEPRYSQIETSPQRWSSWQPPMDVMNVYTGDVHITNFTYSCWAIQGPLPHKRLEECPEPGQARIVGLMGYVEPGPWMIGGIDRDLNYLRVGLMAEGHRRGRIDVFGKGWPGGIAREDSREGNWRSASSKS